MSVKCSVALYMVISSAGEKVGNLHFSQRSCFETSRRNMAGDHYGALPWGSFAALHNYNCRDAKSLSQELFGAAHHPTRLTRASQIQTPDKSVGYNLRS